MEYPKASLAPSDEDSLRLQIPDEQYNMPVDQLDLSVRTMNCLRRASIATVGELITRGEKELLALRNFGQKSKIELEEKLSVIGLSLDPSSNDEAADAEADGEEAAVTADGAVTESEAEAASPETAGDDVQASSEDETS